MNILVHVKTLKRIYNFMLPFPIQYFPFHIVYLSLFNLHSSYFGVGKRIYTIRNNDMRYLVLKIITIIQEQIKVWMRICRIVVSLQRRTFISVFRETRSFALFLRAVPIYVISLHDVWTEFVDYIPNVLPRFHFTVSL